MTTRWVRTAALVAVLVAAGCSSGDSAPPTALPVVTTTSVPATATSTTRPASAVPGITAGSVRIGLLVPDIDRWRAGGGAAPDGLTTAVVINRASAPLERWNASGGVNGRLAVAVPITWNPADPKSYDVACRLAATELDLFVVLNASGFAPERLPCIAVDGPTTVLSGEVLGQGLYADAKDTLFGLLPPAELTLQTALADAVRVGTLPRDAVVGVLRGNRDVQLDAWDRARRVLEQNAVRVAFADPLNTASSTNAQIQIEAGQTVARMRQMGVTHVLVLVPVRDVSSFITQASITSSAFRYVMVETSGTGCSPLVAAASPAEMDGAICYSALDTHRYDVTGAIQRDTTFEAQCRRDHELVSGVRTTPGIPAGGVVQGELRLDADVPYLECSLVNLVKLALARIGDEPTRDAFAGALRALRDVPLAGVAAGRGGFGPAKPYAATQIRAFVFRAVRPEVARGGDGLFRGCPAPRSCFLGSGEWITLDTR